MPPNDPFRPLADSIEERFRAQRRVLSFWEFLEEVRANPYLRLRSAAQYLRDMLDHFGVDEVEIFGTKVLRPRVFDGLPDDPEDRRVVGQEFATDSLYRIVRNFATEGHADKLILMHGPNGSSKSTIADMLFKGLAAYSVTAEGALYKFSWIFPKSLGGPEGSGALGFGGRSDEPVEEFANYAYLDPEEIASTVESDMRTNPFMLVPRSQRRPFLHEACGGEPDFPHTRVLTAAMGTKSRDIYEALLTAFQGDWKKVMRHVRVERFAISRRYRSSAVTIEPQQANIDAESRQVTADFNLANLPPSLQNLRLYEVAGDLADANRGLLEYSDFLKRPAELNKYLLTTTERGTVRMPGALAYLDLVMVGSANEKHLDAFKGDPNFTSFKGRIELLTVPYLLRYQEEIEIYRDQVKMISLNLTVAPHAARCAGLWAVLTRLWRPDPAHYEEPVKSVVAKLTPLAKALLYQGRDPGGLGNLPSEDVKLLRDNIEQIAGEWRDGPIYEGRFGASAREMKTILLDASHRARSGCFTPMLVLTELRNLVRDKSLYDFLKLEPKGDYNDPAKFVDDVERATVRQVRRELHDSMALVDEAEYDRRFEEYFAHAIALSRGATVRDPHTGESRQPDPKVLASVEELVETGKDVERFRSDLIARIGAYSMNHPGEQIAYRELFPDILRALRAAFYDSRGTALGSIEGDILRIGTPAWDKLEPERRDQVELTLANMESRYGYARECALEILGWVLRKRTDKKAGEKAAKK
ncbi:MAG: PrkA family serine protein kinase [Planctomycetota bacterium]|jgi:predicted Ser/Thr protein kinase